MLIADGSSLSKEAGRVQTHSSPGGTVRRTLDALMLLPPQSHEPLRSSGVCCKIKSTDLVRKCAR